MKLSLVSLTGKKHALSISIALVILVAALALRMPFATQPDEAFASLARDHVRELEALSELAKEHPRLTLGRLTQLEMDLPLTPGRPTTVTFESPYSASDLARRALTTEADAQRWIDLLRASQVDHVRASNDVDRSLFFVVGDETRVLTRAPDQDACLVPRTDTLLALLACRLRGFARARAAVGGAEGWHIVRPLD